jgi:iron complex transport system ATP-binding protein
VPQSHAPTFPFKVLDMALMGRAARLGMFASPSRRDETIAMEALDQVGIAHLAGRSVGEISGGERQLTLIARALTQQASLMVLDEPTSNLDFGNQVRVLEHIRNLAARGIGVLMTTHFPDHALLCSSSVAIMHQGRLWTTGAAHEAITERTLRDIYGVHARVVRVTDANGTIAHACIPTIAPFIQEVGSGIIPLKASFS